MGKTNAAVAAAPEYTHRGRRWSRHDETTGQCQLGHLLEQRDGGTQGVQISTAAGALGQPQVYPGGGSTGKPAIQVLGQIVLVYVSVASFKDQHNRPYTS